MSAALLIELSQLFETEAFSESHRLPDFERVRLVRVAEELNQQATQRALVERVKRVLGVA